VEFFLDSMVLFSSVGHFIQSFVDKKGSPPHKLAFAKKFCGDRQSTLGGAICTFACFWLSLLDLGACSLAGKLIQKHNRTMPQEHQLMNGFLIAGEQLDRKTIDICEPKHREGLVAVSQQISSAAADAAALAVAEEECGGKKRKSRKEEDDCEKVTTEVCDQIDLLAGQWQDPDSEGFGPELAHRNEVASLLRTLATSDKGHFSTAVVCTEIVALLKQGKEGHMIGLSDLCDQHWECVHEHKDDEASFWKSLCEQFWLDTKIQHVQFRNKLLQGRQLHEDLSRP